MNINFISIIRFTAKILAAVGDEKHRARDDSNDTHDFFDIDTESIGVPNSHQTPMNGSNPIYVNLVDGYEE